MMKVAFLVGGILLAALVPPVAETARDVWRRLEFTSPMYTHSGNIVAKKMVDDFKIKMMRVEAGLDTEAKVRKCELDLTDLRAVLRDIDPSEKVENVDCRKLVTSRFTTGERLL